MSFRDFNIFPTKLVYIPMNSIVISPVNLRFPMDFLRIFLAPGPKITVALSAHPVW